MAGTSAIQASPNSAPRTGNVPNTSLAIRELIVPRGPLEQFRNYCGLKKIARCGFPWEKTTKRPVASVYTNCETARALAGTGLLPRSRVQSYGSAILLQLYARKTPVIPHSGAKFRVVCRERAEA